jgi:hydroxyacylglutathione hydrolase
MEEPPPGVILPDVVRLTGAGRAIIRAGPGMFLRFFEEGLAQASYLVACERIREGVIVDPRRDIDVYVAAARQQGIEIVAAIETHIHADFVSGARELAATGARVFAGPGAALGFAAAEVRDGERVPLGDLRVEFLHTPGHTPEHVCVLVTGGSDAARLFTGDTLFVGAVGRPDLLGPEQMRMLAGQLYDSLTARILALEDTVEVHPGHGAGSLCGAHISGEPYSTIGRERLTNPMLRLSTRHAFVSAVLADLPDTPPYFGRMKRLNREGPTLLGFASKWRGVAPIDPGAAQGALEDGAILIDLRTPEAFSASHPVGALNIPFGPKIGYWAGWVVPAGARIVLLTVDEREASEAARQLLRVGLDSVMGFVDGGASAWQAARLPAAHIGRLTTRELDEQIGHRPGLTVVDVRNPAEWQSGHIEGSINLPVGHVVDRIGEVPRDRAVATICESGTRSSLAASILARAGISSVMSVRGGMAEYRTSVALRPEGGTHDR